MTRDGDSWSVSEAVAACDAALFAYLKATPEQRERLHDALRRTGISTAEAGRALATLGRVLDTPTP